MADKKVEIALVLSAYDKISSVVNSVVSNTTAKLATMQAYSQKLATMADKSKYYGRESITAGVTMAAPLIAAAKAYADQEEAALHMRTSMMQDGSRINEKAYSQLIAFANKSTDVYGDSAAAYEEMNRVLMENGVTTTDILGGIGTSVEKLALVFKMAPSGISQFAARMKQDMAILPKEMNGMMDLVSRLQMTGVGKNGEESVMELGEFYSKAGIGARLLGATGLQSAKDLGALGGVFMRTGLSGQNVGNNFRRIFDGLRDADKVKKMNDVAKQYGITLDFFDKNHQFKGMGAFVGELGKLQGMNLNQLSAIMKPFGGKTGLSTDFLEVLGKFGVNVFNEYNQALARKATLDAIAAERQKSLNFQTFRLKNQVIGAASVFASTYGSSIKQAIFWLGSMIKTVVTFINNHKKLVGSVAKGIALIAGYRIVTGGAALAFGFLLKGVVNFIQLGGVLGKILMFTGQGLLIVGSFLGRMGLLLLTRGIPAMVSFTATVWANAAAWLANPATYIILAIIAAVAALIAIGILVYKNWDKILRWFKIGWAVLKASVAANIAVFQLFWQILKGIGTTIVGIFTFNPAKIAEGAKEAAAAINSIMAGGIKKVAIEASARSLRESGINPNRPLSEAYNNVKKPIVKNNTGGTVNNHFSPQINLSGSASKDDGKKLADSLKPHWEKWTKEQQKNQLRTSYK